MACIMMMTCVHYETSIIEGVISAGSSILFLLSETRMTHRLGGVMAKVADALRHLRATHRTLILCIFGSTFHKWRPQMVV